MKFKSILLAFIVFVLFVGPASADFSDNFNDLSIVDWTVNSGSWSAATGELAPIGVGSTLNSITSPSIGSGQGIISFDVRCTVLDAQGHGQVYWNTGKTRGLNYSCGGTLKSVGFTIVDMGGFTPTTSYSINATIQGSQIRIRVYTQGTTTLAPGITNNDQNVAYTSVTTDNIVIEAKDEIVGHSPVIRFDNIVTKTLTWAVSGYVNETSGAFINGATVSYSGGSALTNSGGFYSFSSVIDGTYTFTASKTGFASSSQSIVVVSAKTNQNFTLVNTSIQSTNVTWNATEYTRGDTVTFNWNIRDDDWATYDSYFIKVYKNGIVYDNFSFNVLCLCYSHLGLGTQSGIYSLLADEAGPYKVSLQKATASSLWQLYEVVDENTTHIRDYSSSYLVLNSSYPYHTSVNITYHFGFGGINLNYAIQTYFLNPTTGVYDFEHSFFGLSSGENTKQVYFEKVGTYVVKLRNVVTDTVYDQKTTTTTFSAPETSINITNTTIFINKDSYFYGDTIFGNYTIDSTNWTSGQLYLDVYNWNKSMVTSEMQGSGIGWTDISIAQQGDLLVNLLNTPASENFPQTTFVSGYNALRIMLKNSTGGTNILSWQNFTLTDTTANGYGLRLSKYQVLVNEKFFAYATVPENGAKLYLVNTGSDASTGKLLATISLNQSPATIPISIPNTGNYAVILNNPTNDTEIMQNVKVTTQAITVTPTSAVPSSTQANEQMSNNLLNFMATAAFWGLMIFGLIVMVTATATKIDPKSIGIVAFLTANIEAVIGLWSPYTIYILAVTWVIAGIFFIVGRNATE